MDSTFAHRFLKGTGERTMLLLHGTGGDENDLLDLGRELAPEWNLLSPRGRVLEAGMPRFFRRLRPGVFDQDDLREQTEALARFLDAAAKEYGFDSQQVTALGYSNGANIAASLLYIEPAALAAAVLLRPMNPWPGLTPPPLNGLPVLIASGRFDKMSSPQQVERLRQALINSGASVSLHWSLSGHELSPDDIQFVGTWLRR